MNKTNFVIQIFFLCLFFFLLGTVSYSQIFKGKIISTDQLPLSNCLIFIPETNEYTTSNNEGDFSIDWSSKLPLYIQLQGYEKQKIKYKNGEENAIIKLIPLDKNKILYTEKNNSFARFLLSIIYRQFKQRINDYEVDYYARGDIQLNTKRQTFLGQRRKDLDPALDVNQNELNDFIYFGEVKSSLFFQNKVISKEQIKAFQTRGSSKDILFLIGTNNDFNIFNKIVSNQIEVISPLLPYSNSYYNYDIIEEKKLDDQTIYKIQFTPKRESEPVMTGYIEFTDKDWQILFFSAKMRGTNINLKNITELQVEQIYSFVPDLNANLKSNQIISFDGRFLVFDFIGKFESTFRDYLPKSSYATENNSTEYISYQKGYNIDENNKLSQVRPYPLTETEREYLVEKTISLNENTKATLNAIDKRTNNFTLFKLIKGYKYINSYKNSSYSYRGLLSTFAFNAVQGFNITTGIDYNKIHSSNNNNTSFGVNVSYGLSESKFRFNGYLKHVFNQTNYATLSIEGGEKIEQFNHDNPISKPINSVASAWFGKNYAKFFQKKFISIDYSQYIFDNFNINTKAEYAFREVLYNNLESPPFVPTLNFESNNPLDPTDFITKPFENNYIFKFNANIQVVFDQKTIQYPDKKQYIKQSKFPILEINLEKGISPTDNKYNYTFGSITTKYQNNIGNIGELYSGISLGQFFEQNAIAFTDYKHFNGNQTFVGSTAIYNNNFNLLPYYSYSTNKSYIEFHLEHDFRGFITNKIPLLNKTRYSLIIGFHLLSVPEKPTYKEYSIGLNNFGFGKFRPFRIDFVTSLSSNTKKTHGVILGIKILELIQK